MKKSEIITNLKDNKLVLVVRGDSKEEALACSLASIDGGIKSIEITYTNPFASTVIQELREKVNETSEVLIGAGTVLDDVTARCAILAGAQFIASPSFSHSTAKLCNRYGVPYFPGCMTVTEIVNALEIGVDLVKVFPGSIVGVSFIKAIKSPLPQVMLMVTGGVNVDNINSWLDAGVDVLGIGGEFNELSRQGRFDDIREKTREYLTICQQGVQ